MKKICTLLLVFALVSGLNMAYADSAPSLPHTIYGDVSINGLPATGTLKVLVNGVESEQVQVTDGEFGKGLFDPKLVVSGVSGDKLTFSFEAESYTINPSYNIYLVDSAQYVSEIDFASGGYTKILLEFTGTADSGDTGDTGDSGDTGDTGDSGDTGDTGDSGDTGDTGDSGDTGDTGDSGDTGDTGDSGDTGDTGDSGDTGDTGDSGDTGDTGDSGDTGDTGDSGSMPLNPELFYGFATIGETSASGTLNVYVDDVLQDSIAVQNGLFGGSGPLAEKLVATGYVGETNEVRFTLVSGGETYSSFSAEIGEETYTDELPYVEGVKNIAIEFSGSTGISGDTGDTGDTGDSGSMPLNPELFYGFATIGETSASGTLNVYVDDVLQDSIAVQNGLFGGSCTLAEKLVATGYVGETNEVRFTLVSGGETYSSFSAEIGEETYTDELPYVEGEAYYMEISFSESTGAVDNNSNSSNDETSDSSMPLYPELFYGLVYLDDTLASSTLNVYVDDVLQDSIEIENGIFGGEGPLDDKLTATGYEGNSNVVTFSLVSGGGTYSSFTAELSDATYENEIPYDEGVHYVILTFSSEATETGDSASTGGSGSGGSSSGGSSSSVIISSDSSEPSATTKNSDSGTLTKTTSSANPAETSENTEQNAAKNSLDISSDDETYSNETGVVLQQESPLGGINLYLAMAAALLILIAIAAAWYQSREKPEVLPQP
uniref:Collagen triple helix repeat n=1 Tax=Methanococcus maripaludis (strain C6 / ATCC BAA-1332) TaxID=444158 RepID=A9AAB9_METM6